MSTAKELAKAYEDIASYEDHIKAWRAFEGIVHSEKPDVDTLLAITGEPDSKVFSAMWHARTQNVGGSILAHLDLPDNTPLFRGSGIIAVGTPAHILGVDYEGEFDKHNFDMVQTHHFGYQYVALLKLGRASFLANMIGRPGNCMEILRAFLRSEGLEKPGDSPHHLGYDFEVSADGSKTITAGASGMLPSEPVADAMNARHAAIIAAGHEKGWVNWPHDELAGYYDLLAANSTAAELTGQKKWSYDPEDLAKRGGNLH
jgi:hypothetical protein